MSSQDLPIDAFHHAEALKVRGQLPKDSVDLIYIDPPFGTGQLRRLAEHQARRREPDAPWICRAGLQLRSSFGLAPP
jgi:16S rRNA G966 N2-methylase RsmD